MPSRPAKERYVFPVIDTTSLFIGTIGVDDFVIFVDSSDSTRLQGHYLPLVDTVADTVAFCLKTNGRKLWLSYKDVELVLRPRDLTFVDGHYRGVARLGLFRTTRFDLSPLELPDFQYYDDSRYQEPLFSVETVTDVPYASVSGYWDELASESAVSSKIFNMGKAVNERPLELKLDVYLPKDDTLRYRPTVMLAHGGAFYFGSKNDLAVTRWCRHLASLGYVAVSIDYRLGFIPSKNAIVRAGYRAAQDAHAAMRYLVSERETYGIDTSMLFVGGCSAGAIATLNLVYMTNETRPASTYGDNRHEDLGAIDTCGNDLRCDFNVKGIVDMWGALTDTTMMQGHHEPILAFHGDADDIVPYGYDYPFGVAGAAKTLFVDKMYGSSCIVDRALESGGAAQLVTFTGYRHAPHLSTIN
ncbi:MAG: alpha/beta hydrolase, partial [Bacteroidales bacterium]|nr:alpha/beta hydrolase [Bacteroidales bacterium]